MWVSLMSTVVQQATLYLRKRIRDAGFSFATMRSIPIASELKSGTEMKNTVFLSSNNIFKYSISASTDMTQRLPMQ